MMLLTFPASWLLLPGCISPESVSQTGSQTQVKKRSVQVYFSRIFLPEKQIPKKCWTRDWLLATHR